MTQLLPMFLLILKSILPNDPIVANVSFDFNLFKIKIMVQLGPHLILFCGTHEHRFIEKFKIKKIGF